MKIVIATQGLPFNGHTTKHKALGGSETAVIEVAKELHKLGNEVVVYNNCEKPGKYDGVYYHNFQDDWQDFVDIGYADIVIVSRFVQILGQKLNSKLNILWNHDILVPEIKDTLFSLTWNIDYMYFLSNYHKNQYLEILPELKPIAKLNTNGIDTDLIPKQTNKKHKIMFTSRPERGLYKALELYEKIGDKELEFLICNYQSIPTDEVLQVEKMCAEKAMQLIEQGFDIRFDQFTKEDLYKNMAESKAVIYTTQFPEISCIGAMEAQACGTAYICTNDFALKETVGYQGITFNKDYDDNFIKRIKEVIYNDDVRQDVEKIGLEHVKNYTWQKVAKRFVDDANKHFKERSKDVDGVIDRLIYESDIVCARELANLKAKDRLPELNHYLRHLENEEEQKKLYEYDETHEKADVGLLAKLPRFQWLARVVEEDGIKTLLDYACHTGAASYAVGANGNCKVLGYDISTKAVEVAKSYLDKYNYDIDFTSTEPPADQFEAVFNGEMLEHVLDPEAMIDKLEKYVKPGGKMYITLPKGAWEYNSREENRVSDRLFHVNEFDTQDVIDMLGNKKDFDMQVLYSGYHSGYGEPLGNYLISYVVDGTPTGKRDFKRKWLTTRPHQSISLCMIGKNAQKTIEQTLDSLKDLNGNLVPDEIILADDNSTDDMAIRAEKYGAKVIKMPHSITEPDLWGFANARNFSIEQAKGKWILWVDTDELVKGFDISRKYLEGGLINAFVVRQYHAQRDNYIKADTPQRLFKKGKGKFYGYIHEQAQADINNPIDPALIFDEAEIWNMGSATEGDRRKKSLDRNLPLLDKDWKENVIKRKEQGKPIRKLTPILVMRDLLNRLYWSYESLGTYDTKEVHERILPRMFELYNKYCKKETGLYKEIAEDILQQLYTALGIGHDIDLKLDNKQLKKRYVSLDDLMEDIKKM